MAEQLIKPKTRFEAVRIGLPLSLLLLSLALATVTQSRGQESGPEDVDKIKTALRAQDFAQALERAHAALELSPRSPQLWTLAGVAYSGEGRKKEARSSFRKALEIDPNYLPALEQAAQLEFEAGNMAAVPLLEQILRLRSGDPTSHAMIAVLEYKHGSCQAAVPHFAQAGDILDSQMDALHAYATCLVRLKRLDEATNVFAHAVALQPDSPRERQLLASIQLMAHKPEAALYTLKPLLETSDARPEVVTLELASSAYEEAHDTARAVELLRKAILLAPNNVSLYLEFAHLCSSHASFQVGVDVVSDGIHEQPNSAPLYFARGVLYVNLGQYEAAEADFDKAYEVDPGQSLTAAARGLLEVQRNDLDHALADVRKKLEAKPKDPVLLYLEADILAQRGAAPGSPDFEKAAHSAEQAIRLRPSLAPARAVLAKLYLDSGRSREAVEQCRKALESDPKDQTSLYRLIQALRKTGQTQELPALLTRLAQLREESARDERQRYRYKLVE